MFRAPLVLIIRRSKLYYTASGIITPVSGHPVHRLSVLSQPVHRPVRKADNLPPSCAVVTKSGNLKFLEPSGPVQACNGTALPLPLPYNCIL